MNDWSGPPKPPRGFIASSAEGIQIAQTIQDPLAPVAECTIWNQALSLGSTAIESLTEARVRYHFAVFVFAKDDIDPGIARVSVRRNDMQLFEIWLFTGASVGPERSCSSPTSNVRQVPADLGGMTAGVYRTGGGDIARSLRPAVTQIARRWGSS